MGSLELSAHVDASKIMVEAPMSKGLTRDTPRVHIYISMVKLENFITLVPID
jgi:hypothetical protein